MKINIIEAEEGQKRKHFVFLHDEVIGNHIQRYKNAPDTELCTSTLSTMLWLLQ